jgi:Flp pilus assembly secretin CpaC
MTAMIEKLRAFESIIALIFFAATFSPSWAADPPIVLGLGTPSALLLERPFKTIWIGDPNIVDVLKRSNRSVILQPRNLGATNVIFLDERSIVVANVGILVCKAATSDIAYRDRPDCGHFKATTNSPI